MRPAWRPLFCAGRRLGLDGSLPREGWAVSLPIGHSVDQVQGPGNDGPAWFANPDSRATRRSSRFRGWLVRPME
jgi:hypothetical protein